MHSNTGWKQTPSHNPLGSGLSHLKMEPSLPTDTFSNKTYHDLSFLMSTARFFKLMLSSPTLKSTAFSFSLNLTTPRRGPGPVLGSSFLSVNPVSIFSPPFIWQGWPLTFPFPQDILFYLFIIIIIYK